jgi:adenine-specific DNA methylase
MRYLERDLPIEGLNAIPDKQGNAQKPIYRVHRWWARRSGSVFRMLILAAFTEWDDSLSPEENHRRLDSSLKKSQGCLTGNATRS